MTARGRWWLLAVLAAACHAPARLVVHEDQSEVRGDVIYRPTPFGDTVVILAVRSLGSASAPGDAVLLHTTLAQAEASPHHALAGARAWLALSRQVDGDDAFEAAHRGLAELGRDYHDGHTEDETSIKIHLAESCHRTSPLQDGLASRIRIYLRRYRGTVQ